MTRVTLVAPEGPLDPGRQGLLEAADHALSQHFEVSLGPLAALRPGTAIVVVGGTPLALGADGAPAPTLRRLRWLAPLARAFGDPLVLLGVGAALGPGSSRPITRVVERADLLVLRDEESALSLRLAGVTPPFRVGADPTWTLLDRAGVVGADRTVSEGALLIPDREGVLARAVIDALDEHELPARLVGWGSPELAGRPGPSRLVEASALLARAELVISLRLHGLVAAAAAGTPCVAVGDDPGLGELAARLGQTWVPEPTAPGVLAAAVDQARWVGPPAHSAVKAEVARAEEGFRLARLLISRGQSEEAETLVGLPLAERPWA